VIPSGQVTGSLPADEVLAERVDKLLDAVRAEVVLEDTDHPLFHGSWDWHSSVHAHWALLALGALRGRRSETQWVIERMRSDAWRAEIEHLQAHPDFELPYGRAWLLALAHDYERLSGDRGLRQTLEPVASALFDWCKSTSLGPQTQEYQNPC